MILSDPYYNSTMAKWEIHKRMGNPLSWAWWKFMPGKEIIVKWPSGLLILNETGIDERVSAETSDPNDWYRPDLEKHIGKQGWDWDWRIGPTRSTKDTLIIKIRKGKIELATFFQIKWGV